MDTETSRAVVIEGKAWIAGPGDDREVIDTYWAEGELARVEVERTEPNEIRVGVQLKDSETDDATIYLTQGEAQRLCFALGAALLEQS